MNGVFRMPMAEYLRADGLSQSKLKLLDRSPAHFKQAIDDPEEESDALRLGSLIHTRTLEPHLFEEGKSHFVRPDIYQNDKKETKDWNGNANACKDWLERHSRLPVVRTGELEMIKAVAESIRKRDAAKLIFKEGAAEQVLFIQDPITGHQLKCRCDWMSGNTIVDLKSTKDASPAGFSRAIAEFGYDVQAAFNLDLAKWLNLGKNYFVFAACEKEPPYEVAFYELNEASIDIGRSKYRHWLDLYDFCFKNDEWPGYDPAILKIDLPMWAVRNEQNLLMA